MAKPPTPPMAAITYRLASFPRGVLSPQCGHALANSLICSPHSLQMAMVIPPRQLRCNGLGEGESRTPHPTVFVEHSALPSPARGEGTITSAEISDAVVLVRVTHEAAGIEPE